MRRIAILCLLLTGCATSRLERIVDAAVAAPVAENRFAGVVLVARDGRPILRKAYGLADRERNVPHDARHDSAARGCDRGADARVKGRPHSGSGSAGIGGNKGRSR